jgi:hypothetical protein
MTIAYVQNPKFANTGSATTIAAPAFNLTTGNHVFVAVRYETAAASTAALADTAGNTYTKLTEQNTPSGTAYSDIWYCISATGNASNVVTCTFGEAKTYRAIHVIEFSATDPVQYDGSVYATGQSSSSTTVTSASFNTTGSCIVLAHQANFNADAIASKTWSAGYALLDDSANFDYSSATYKISTVSLTGETLTYTGTSALAPGRVLTVIAFSETQPMMGQACL